MITKCKQVKHDGTPCEAYPMTGSEFCYLHNPDITDEEKRLNQSKGGARALQVIPKALPPVEIGKPQDVVTLLVDTIGRVRAGELDIKVANCIGVLSGHLIKAFETAQLDDRLAMIQQVIIDKRR